MDVVTSRLDWVNICRTFQVTVKNLKSKAHVAEAKLTNAEILMIKTKNNSKRIK